MTETICITTVRDEALARSNSCFNVHDHLKNKSVEELRAISDGDRMPWHTLCLNVTGDLNVGTMVRTSHCLGAKSVIVFGRQRIDNRSLVGAANYIKYEKILGIDDKLVLNADLFIKVMTERNLTPIFVEMGGTSLSEFDWCETVYSIINNGKEPCLIMGNEGDGIPEDILNTKSLFYKSMVVSIPMRGVIRSMNVAVAHSIVSSDLCLNLGWM